MASDPDLLETLRRDNQPIRLHLGCGQQLLPGYVNVDYPQDQHSVMAVRADLEADLTQMSMPGGAVDEVRLHHVFEHFNRVVALGLLIRWRGWLKPGGLLWIETPDFVGTAEAALRASGPDRMAFIRHLEGDQTDAWGYHVGQWHRERFESTLTALGFEKLEFEASSSERWHRVGLKNIAVKAARGSDRPLDQLVEAADALLWESTVADSERPTYEAWRLQLRAFLNEGVAADAPRFHEPLTRT